MQEIIATGKTVEEATEKGCAELGLDRDEVSVEILEMPAKKLFKTIPAKVKVSALEQALPEVIEQPVAQKAAPIAKVSAPVKQEKALERQQAEPILPAEPEEELDMEKHPNVKMAGEYLISIFNAIGVNDMDICAIRQGDATLFRLESDEIADKIDVRGEVIQALSYLVDRSVNSGVDKKEDEYLRIRLDIAGYRNRREGELISLANRVGKEVARTARSRTLSPMNPYERLIVHTAISKIEGITSESIGVDTERRVVVKSLAANATDGGDWRPARKGNDRDRGGRSSGNRNANRASGRGGSRDGGKRRSGGSSGGGSRGGYEKQSNTPQREYAERERDPNAAPVVPSHREAVRDGDDLPLYGKIEL